MENINQIAYNNITCGPNGGTGRVAIDRAKDKFKIQLLEKDKFQLICEKQFILSNYEELQKKFDILIRNCTKLEWENTLLKKENESLTLLNKSVDDVTNLHNEL